MAIALVFGVIQIALGLILNIVNEFLKGEKLKAILSGKGLIGLIYYVGGVILAVKYIYNMTFDVFTENIVLTGIVVAALLIIFFSPLIEGAVEGHINILEGLMTGFSEALETFISYLTNSISYVRLAAFAMAHVALGLSAISLAEALGVAGSYLFMNFLVILIEGMSVLIQSMRLTYYEFFTKFYSGEGRAFKPFHLEF